MRDKALRDAREEQQELEALQRLDEECIHQQRAGNYLKAFDCMERALVLRRHFFGIESDEVLQACRALAEMCNLLAMSFLQQDNYSVTIDLLKKAEVLTQRHHPVERATTLNNFACYYRRLGKLHAAMTSLKRALELEKRLENVRNAADTQLNMCAVLSQLGKHQEALEHAQEALITLQEGFIHGKHTTDASPDTSEDTSSARLDRISVMCIAYHNIGVEQEFLKDYAESVASYKKGIGLAEQYLGADHSITTTIRNSYLAAKRTLATKARVRPCSASRDPKSPTKAGARLLLSPRSGSLRMPSPLAKEKDHGSQIPTPRSIIADALSRAPLSALPPLEIQCSPSAGNKKTKKAGEEKSITSSLSPTDPFFSPRFRFDSDTNELKTKRLASITSPRSVVVANTEVQTPPSSKGKSERRKSSVKKFPAAGVTGRRDRKSSADERMKTVSTSRTTEDDLTSAVSIRGDEAAGNEIGGSSRECVATEPSVELQLPGGAEVSVALVLADSSELPAVSTRSAAVTATKHELEIADANEHQHVRADSNIGSMSQELGIPVAQTVQASKYIMDPVLEDAAGAILTVLTKIIDKIAEEDLQSNVTDTVFEDEDTAVGPSLKQQRKTDDLDFRDSSAFAVVSNGDSVETGEDAINPTEVEADLEGDNNNLEDHDEDNMEVGSTHEEQTLISDSTGETSKPAHGEQSLQFIEDETTEDTTKVDVDSTNQRIERDPEAGSEYHATTEKYGSSSESDPHYTTARDELMLEEHLNPPEGDQTNLMIDTQDQVVDQKAEKPQSLNGADVAAIDHDAQYENLDTEDRLQVTEELHLSTEGYEIKGYHDENYASAEVETQEYAYEGDEQEVDSIDHYPLDQELVYQTEQEAAGYEQQGYYTDVESALVGEAQLDWSQVEQAEPVTAELAAEYSDYYQDPSVPSQEECFFYDEHVSSTENVDDQLHEAEDFHFPTDVTPDESAVNVATISQDAAIHVPSEPTPR